MRAARRTAALPHFLAETAASRRSTLALSMGLDYPSSMVFRPLRGQLEEVGRVGRRLGERAGLGLRLHGQGQDAPHGRLQVSGVRSPSLAARVVPLMSEAAEGPEGRRVTAS